MKILVTGANGFIGRNLVMALKENKCLEISLIDIHNTKEELREAVINSEFIFHLAGVNRPVNEEEFTTGNKNLTEEIVDTLIENRKNTPIIITSSIQAENNTAYGISKLESEKALRKYREISGAKILIYRLPNVFGKWSKPNYNSAVATFCYNIARGKEIWVSDSSKEIKLVYIDDVVRSFIKSLYSINQNLYQTEYEQVDVFYTTTLGNMVSLIRKFKDCRSNLVIPDMNSDFEKKLYSTYLSFIPEDEFEYDLKMNLDDRGSFTEFLKSNSGGQISINISKPGITKGNHWHHTKCEKFLVVSGEGIVKFRRVDSDKVIEYKVSGENLKVIDVPVGYTHNIINTGENDMVTVMWVNEIYNPDEPDTFYLEV